MGKVTLNLDKQATHQANLDCALGNHKQCTNCCKKFGLFLREAKCYMCKRSTCNDCLIDKQKLVYVKNKKIHENDKKKICLNCDQEIKAYKEQQQFMSKGVSKDSAVSISWLKALKLINDDEKKDEGNPEEKINNTVESLDKKYRQQQEKQLIKVTQVRYKDFLLQKVNYSFLYHIHQTCKESSFEQIQQIICRLVNKLALHYGWEKAPIKIDIVLLFILTFSSESSTFYIFIHLYDNVFPRYIVESMQFNTEVSKKGELWSLQMAYLFKTITINAELNEDQTKYVTTFLEKYVLDLLSSLFINILSFKFSFDCFNKLIQTQKFSTIEEIMVQIMLNELKNMKELSNTQHFNTYTYLIRTIKLEDISSFEITYPSEQESTTSSYKNLPTIFLKPTDSEQNENNNSNTPSSQSKQQQDKEQKNNNQRNTLKTTQEFQQHYEEMMMSPHFNLLIANNMNDNHQEQSDDEFEEIVEESPQSNRHQQRQEQELKSAPIMLPQQQFDQNDNNKDTSPSIMQIEAIHIPLQNQQSYSNDCQKCLSKDKIIQQLRIENETMQEEIAKQQQEFILKDKSIEELKQKHIEEQDKLKNEIKELNELQSKNAYQIILNKYKVLLDEAKVNIEKITNEKWQIEEQLIQEKEEILVQSIKDKALLMNEIQEFENINQELTLSYQQNQQNLQKQLDEEIQKISQLQNTIDQQKTEISQHQEQYKIQEQLISQNKLIQTEIVDSQKKSNENYNDKIKEFQNIIDELQRIIAKTQQDHKQEIDLFTDQNNIVFEELRLQINEYENKIKELQEQLDNLQEKLILESQLHQTMIQTLKQEQEVEKLTLKNDYENNKSQLIQENQDMLNQKNQVIEELQKTIDELNQQLQNQIIQFEENKNTLLQQFEDEKKDINNQNQLNLQQKDEIIKQLEERMIIIKQENEEQKDLIKEQFELEKQQINNENLNKLQEKQIQIDQLNNQLNKLETDRQVDKINLYQQFEQEKNQIFKNHELQLQEKDEQHQKLEEQIQQQKDQKLQIEQKNNLLNEELNEKNNEIEQLKMKLQEVEQKVLEKNKMLASHQITVLEKDDEISQLQHNINKQNEQIQEYKEMEKQFEQAKHDILKLNDLNKQIVQLKEELNHNKDIINNLNSSITEKDKIHSSCDETINKLKDDLEKIKLKLQQKQNELNVYLNIFQSVKQTVNEVDKDKSDN